MLPLALALAIQIAPPSADTPYRQPQLAVSGEFVVVAFGSGNDIYVVSSRDAGRTFGTPVRIATGGKMALGRHRGPRVAIAGNTVVISAPVGEKGGGADGDLLAWRSADGGRGWAGPSRINDRPAGAREGLHAMAGAPDGTVFAVWLDSREGRNNLYGAKSADGGATWSRNVIVYRSPDGHICECCHPSAAIGAGGTLHAMWRNWLNGSRDLYLASSTDGGATFRSGKLGQGTWPLNACPMDGGGLALDGSGNPVSVWRRDAAVYLDRPGAPEIEIGRGKDPSIAVGPEGVWVAWNGLGGLRVKGPGKAAPELLDAAGEYVNLAGGEHVYAVWESRGRISIRTLSGP